MQRPTLVIIGGVAAGASAAAKARRCNEEARIIMIEKDPDISYATCGLPYYLSGVINNRDDLLITSSRFFAKRFNVDVRTRQEVLSINARQKKLSVRDLVKNRLYEQPYDKLVIATGASAVIPPVPGTDLPFVFTLKTLEDTDTIFAYIKDRNPAKAVVVGGGLIGMEVAENLARKKIAVSVVEFLPQVLSFLDAEMAHVVQTHLQEKGVTLYCSEKVTAVEQDNGRGWVRTSGDRVLPADLVLMAVGVRPNTMLAEQAGLALGTTGAIKVDEAMRTSDPDIFAAGDCVESISRVTGKPMLFPMGSAANKQGRAAGANAMGRNIVVKGFTGTVIVKVFDLAVAKTGLSEQEAMGAGFSPLVTYLFDAHHAGYYPGAQSLRIKAVADRDTGRLLGAQVIGKQGVDKRVDVLSTAIYNGMAQDELLQLDLAYAPPYSSARDPVIVTGALAQNYYAKDWTPITPAQLYKRLQHDNKMVLIDLRTPKELQKTGIIPGAVHIPIDELRGRIKELDPAGDIVLYCAVGLRSYVGHRILAMNGFSRVSSLTGGLAAWTYPVEPYH